MDRLTEELTPEQAEEARALMAKYGWDVDEAIFAVALADGEIEGDVVVVDRSGTELRRSPSGATGAS